MDKLLNPGRNMFAAAIIALAIISILSKDFILGRPPSWPASFNPNPVLAYVSATILIICSLAIFSKRNGATAAIVIALLVFVLSLSRHVPNFMNDWANTYKTMALCGGSLLIAATFIKNRGEISSHNSSKKNVSGILIFTGSLLVGLFFIASGYAHFKFADFVIAFIPAYIPFHAFWTYFCGICLFAGGIGLIIPYTRKWAALLSAIMILGWFLLLHIPLVIANPDAGNKMGLCESFAFSGILFALAGFLSKKTNYNKL